MNWLLWRRIGLLFLFVLAGWLSYYLYGFLLGIVPIDSDVKQQTQLLLGILTGLLIFLLMTRIGRNLISHTRQFIDDLSAYDVIYGIISIIIGLTLGALLAFPLGKIPNPYGWASGLVTQIVVTLLTLWVLHIKKASFAEWTGHFFSSRHDRAGQELASQPRQDNPLPHNNLILDTSAIIDGRIGDVTKSGFMFGTLLVPDFVVEELQTIADSPQTLKRQRGRQGLRLLQSLKRAKQLEMEIVSPDIPHIEEVDQRLIAYAKQIKGKIVTCDYNLNRAAKLHGIPVLNVNDLANILKTRFLPGDKVQVQIMQIGKDPKQGIGYMQDGTMVVVENAARYLDQHIQAQVQRVIQTAAGRMVFAKPNGVDEDNPSRTPK